MNMIPKPEKKLTISEERHHARCELYGEIAGHLETILHGYDGIERKEAEKMIKRYTKLYEKSYER